MDARNVIVALAGVFGRIGAVRRSRVLEDFRRDTGLDLMSLVDPELRPAFNANASLSGQALRSAVEQSWPHRDGPGRSTRTIPGRHGAPEVRVRVADPEPGATGRPVYLHMHGGGYIRGVANASMDVARSCGCVVVSVDYRLAPKTPFPGSLEDNYAALLWVHKHADELGVDRERIAIGGESAGGGHAAALAIAARDRGEVPVAFQVLVYPMLDDRTGSSNPAPPEAGALVWTPAANRKGWSALLGQPAGLPTAPSGAVPARVDDLAGLPPAWIGVGLLDLFARESEDYAARLRAAGVEVELETVPAAYHAFDSFVPEAAASMRFTDSWHSALRRAFAT